MSENNYGAFMMKSAVAVSDDIDAIIQPGIYFIPPANSSSPDNQGGVLTVHSGNPIIRTFTSDSVICLTSTRNNTAWSAWRGPLSRTNPFADIKADGAAAISTALTNLGLSVFSHDAITSLIYSPDKKYNLNVNNDGAWGCGFTGLGGWNPLSMSAGGTGATNVAGALANLASITTGGDYIIIDLPGCRVQIFDRILDSDPTIGNIKSTAVTFPVAFSKRCDFIGYSKYTNPATLCSCEGNTMTGFVAAVVNVLGVVGTTSQFRFIAWGE